MSSSFPFRMLSKVSFVGFFLAVVVVVEVFVATAAAAVGVGGTVDPLIADVTSNRIPPAADEFMRKHLATPTLPPNIKPTYNNILIGETKAILKCVVFCVVVDFLFFVRQTQGLLSPLVDDAHVVGVSRKNVTLQVILIFCFFYFVCVRRINLY